MKTIVFTLVSLLLLAAAGGAVFIYSGVYDVAATTPHWSPTRWVLEEARTRAVRAHAKGIAAPADLGSRDRIVAGTAHFADHCALCHAAPGVEADDLAQGMYPKPPALTDAAKRYTAGELFWILKHGLKMTGMPSWGDHGDDDLWNAVAFLEKLPGMTPAEYQALTEAAEAAGGHRKHGDAEKGGTEPDSDAHHHAHE